MNYRIRSSLSLLIVVICFFGCAATIKKDLNDSIFQEQNLPIRTLKVAIVSDGSRNDVEVEELINKASESLKEQIGVELKIAHWFYPIEWAERWPTPMVNKVHQIVWDHRHEFDIAIAPATMPLAEKFFTYVIGSIVPAPTWYGCIDDTWRRYIVIKGLDKHVLTS